MVNFDWFITVLLGYLKRISSCCPALPICTLLFCLVAVKLANDFVATDHVHTGLRSWYTLSDYLFGQDEA